MATRSDSVNVLAGPAAPRPSRLGARLRRLGFGGFVFFLAKGMLWLAIPAVLRLLA